MTAAAARPDPRPEPSRRTDDRVRVMFLSACVNGGGVGRSLVAYLEREADRIEPIVVMPEPGVIADRLPPSADVHYVPELLERVQRSPYRLPRKIGWPPLEIGAGLAAITNACFAVTRLARELRPDVVYCNHMITKPVGAFVGSRTGIPVVFHARNVHVHWFGRGFYRFIAGLENTRLVVANSRASADPYEGAGAEVVVVPNFVDLDHFDRQRVKPKLREEYNLPSDAPVIGYLGRLVPKKGVDVLIRAFARAHRDHPQARLALVGGNDSGMFDDWQGRYEALARSLGVGDHVLFLGFRDDVAPYAADFDINVLPSIEPESFGRALIEAMALGVPSIATAQGGPLEVIEPGVNGLLAEPGSVGELARHLATLLGDVELRRRMGERGLRDVRERYAADRISTRITQELCRVAGKPAPRDARARADAGSPDSG